MLLKIKLRNFKCFEQLELDCVPLNLLCGLNGMGKSSVIQALLVLLQSFETREFQNGRLVLAGERIDLGTGSDVLFEDAKRDILGFSLESDAPDPDYGRHWEVNFDVIRTADLLDASWNGPEQIAPAIEARTLEIDTLDKHPRFFANRPHHAEKLRQSQDTSHVSVQTEEWIAMGQPPFGGHLVYLNAERVGPRKSYPLSDMLARRGDFGTSGEYAWNYLNRNQDELFETNDPRCLEKGRRRLLDVVDQWLQHVCPSTHLNLESVNAADAVIAGFAFDRPGDVASNRYRSTNVGFGLSYTLPVIIALLSPAGTLCLIENPEAHLHPRGQTKLGELAARAAKAGLQVFAETHSDHFMDGVRIAVRDGLIEPKHAAFHYFERDGNRSIASSLKADSDGRLSHWPEGFFDQHAQNMMKLLAPR